MSPLSCSSGSLYSCCVYCVYLSYTYSSIEATCPSIPAVRFASRLCFIRFVFVVRSCFVWLTKAEARTRVGRPQTSSSPPVIFIAGRPKAALLFWFFGGFLLLQNFSVAIFVSPHVCFILVLILISMFLR